MREATGSLYTSRGSWFLAISLKTRVHLKLRTCRTRPEAELRQQLVVSIVGRLRAAGNESSLELICRQTANADDADLPAILQLVVGLAAGTERVAPPPARASSLAEAANPGMTLRAFGKAWTDNELAKQYRGRIRVIDHEENARRLENHVYPIMFRGRAVGETPIEAFTLDVADHVLAQPTIPAGSLRHVAQIMHRLLKLAVYPVRVIQSSPFPPGWLPPCIAPKERGYIFPEEDAALMAHVGVPLIWRLFFGFVTREGMRRENAATVEWDNFTLNLSGPGHIVLDETKNGRGASWALDPGTTEALRRWQRICPPGPWVFPTEALPRFRRRRSGKPLHVDHAAEILRAALKGAGVARPKLFQNGNNRMQLRAHDLRATFVTLSLANGRSEDWVMRRTGHSSSIMLNRYRRESRTAQELGLGWLLPLHEAIPELAALG
jgi:integrase